GINNAGQVVGCYQSTAGVGFSHGFLLSGGMYSTLDVPVDVLPTSHSTCLRGINYAGQIVGSTDDLGFNTHGFLYSGGQFTLIDVPGSNPGRTIANGINNAGQIVGTYSDGTGTHGFLATPSGPAPVPEPATLTLISIGLVVIGISLKRRSRR